MAPFTHCWNATYLWNPVQPLIASSMDSEVRSDAFFTCMYMSLGGLGGAGHELPKLQLDHDTVQ